MDLIPAYHLRNNTHVTSLWIAQECGKQHQHVLRDIKLRASRGASDFSPDLDETRLTYGKGRPTQVIWLSLAEAALLMSSYTGYKAERARVMCLSLVDAGMARHVPGYKAQHKELYKGTTLEVDAGTDYEDDPVMKQLREINKSISAQLQTRAKVLELEKRTMLTERKVEEHEERLNRFDGDTGYRSVLAYCRENKIQAPGNVAKTFGHRAASLCKQYGYKVGKVKDERYGEVNSYPIKILEQVCTT